MADRFDFQSPSFNIASTIRMILDRDMAEEEKQKAAARQAEQLKLQQAESTRQDAELKIRQGIDARAAAAATDVTRRNDTADVEKAVATAGVGGALPPALIPKAQALAPSMIQERPGMTPMLPNTGTEGTGLPPVAPGSMVLPGPSAPPTVVSAGTKQQQMLKGLRDRPDLTDQQKTILDLVESSGSGNLSSEMMKDFFPGGDVRTFTRKKDGSLVEHTAKGMVPYNGPLPAKHVIVPEGSTGQGAAPYFMFMGSDQGIVKGNARTGELTPTGIGNKAGAGAQQRMVDMSAAMSQISLLKDEFKPEYVGPLQGRYNNVYTRLVDDPDKAALARYQTRIASLKNRFIKAITGAQMSEPEAKRIMSQLPDLDLPDTTFWARLDISEQELGNILDIENQVASGVRKPVDQPVTEAALRKLFPDKQFEPKKGDTKTPTASTGVRKTEETGTKGVRRVVK